MMVNKNTLITFIIGLIIFCALGFFLGRSTSTIGETNTVVKYVKGEKITDSIPYPEPYEVVKPTDTASVIQDCIKKGIYTELFPEKTNIEYVVITKEDTSAIIQDWGIKRLYHETLFDNDTVGSCEIDAEVQYNRLSHLLYTYVPIQKETTITQNKVRFFSPFIGFGAGYAHWSDNKDWLLNANLGFFIKETYGLNIQYNRSLNFETNYLGCSFIYKF